MKRCFYFLIFAIIYFSCSPENNETSQRKAFNHALSNLHPDGKGKDQLYLPGDLEADVWAESPKFYNPTNMDIDHKGRIWITEAVNYRDFNNKGPEYKNFEEGDRVVILEDLDNDGRADTSKVFVQDKDLRSPLGIAVIGNKVIVSCSPSMIIYTDEDGDDKPDKKEKFLTGFGGRDHDHGLHAAVAGPDGKWYFNAGNAGPHKVTDQSGWTLRAGSIYTGGTPYNTSNQPALKSDDGRMWVGGVALRINPDGTGLKVMGHNFRNNYEIALDSYGNIWQNDNDDQVAACRTTFLMEGGNAGYFSRDGSRFWRADRRPGQSYQTAHWHQEDPGVIPAGDISGAGAPTGVVVYEGTQLGSHYNGMLLSADAGRNVIFGYLPEKNGAGYNLTTHRFLSSVQESTEGYIWHEEVQQDKWFRPSDVAVGPDGAIYVADWFDPVVGGHQMKEKEGYGRIYRITPENKALNVPEMDLSGTKGQIKALKNPAVNVRNIGFQRLKAKGKQAFEPVSKLLDAENKYHRARAVWLLVHLGEKGLQKVENLLNAGDPDLRVTAFRALKQNHPDKLLNYASQLTDDPAPEVRRVAAIAMRELSFDQSKSILLDLAKAYPVDDPWYLEALGIGMDSKESAMYEMIVREMGNQQNPEQWPERIADLAWRLHPEQAIGAFRTRALSSALSLEERKKALVALGFINSQKAADAMVAISERVEGDIREKAQWWLQYRKSNAWNAFLKDWENPQKNTLKTHPEIVDHKNTLLNDQVPVERQFEIAKSMAKDAAGGIFLLTMAIRDQLPDSIMREVPAYLSKNPDPYLQVMAKRVLGNPDNTTNNYYEDSVAKIEGNPDKGKILFYKNCLSCHRVGETGSDFGPDLTNIKGKFDRNGLLNAIIKPDEAVGFAYEPWLITTQDGRATYGTILTNGEITVIKSLAGNQYVFEEEEIMHKVRLRNSMMPAPDELDMDEQDLADVAAYLMNFEAKN